MLTTQDFINAGYKRFEHVKHVRSYATYGLQKLISDGEGKRYYITVYAYDNRLLKLEHPAALITDFSFESDVQFHNDMVVNVQFGINEKTSIEQIESMYHLIWLTVGSPYYELWS